MLNVCKDLDISKNILIFASLKKETIMVHFDISEIVAEYCANNGLEYVNTTDDKNAYPSWVKVGIIGFSNSQQLMETQDDLQSIFGDKANVNIEILSKKDGWKLYVHNPHFTCNHDYGFTLAERGLVDVTPQTDDEAKYLKDVVSKHLVGFCDFCGLGEFIKVCDKIWEFSELKLQEGRVITAPDIYPYCSPSSIDTDMSMAMQYHDDDVTFYVYGLVIYPNVD